MNLARDVKGNKKGFCISMNSKRKTQKNVGLLLKAAGELMRNKEEVKLFSAFLPESLQVKLAIRKCRTQTLEGKSGARKTQSQYSRTRLGST